MKKKGVLPLFLCAALSQTAAALTGEELYSYCGQQACGGYFVGAFDAISVADAIVGGSRKGGALHLCPPADVSDERVVDVAMTYLQNHPQMRYLQAANLSLRAWAEAWPCEGNGK